MIRASDVASPVTHNSERKQIWLFRLETPMRVIWYDQEWGQQGVHCFHRQNRFSEKEI